MRSKYLSLGLMHLALALESAPWGYERPRDYEPTPFPPPKPKGKKFIIDGIEVYALNEKNARRKVKNLI
jgi:hypothetical protein